MDKKIPNIKRLVMNMPIEFHHELKVVADKHHMTITAYVMRLLKAMLEKEKSYE